MASTPERCNAEGMRPPAPFSTLVKVDLAGLSHPGRVRPNNQDHFLTCRYGRFLQPLQTNLPPELLPPGLEETGYGMAIADGAGGGPAGELASQMAIQILLNLVLHRPDWILRLDEEASFDEVAARTAERTTLINQALVELVKGDPNLKGFATTLTVAKSLGKDMILMAIGDSRAYLLRRGELRQLTKDHTLAQEMAEVGIIDQHKVASHELRHVLTRALGSDSKDIRSDVQWLRLEDGDCLLLCTDGLTEMVAASSIVEVLSSAATAAQQCQHLIDRALDAGGRDNVTAIIAHYHMPA